MIVFISARVHPGETTSSYALRGILKFLLNKTDEYIDQISGLLKDQQSDEKSTNATANENDGEAETETVAAPSLLPQIEDQTSSYYETAHVRQEQVAQPSNLWKWQPLCMPFYKGPL